MPRRIWIPALLIVALLSLAYAIYRSTAQRITIVQNGQETVYGEPQHGLILGLCILSCVCIISAVGLLRDSQPHNADQQSVNRRTF